MIAGKGGALQM